MICYYRIRKRRRNYLFNICIVLGRRLKERNVERVCILFCRCVIDYFFRCLYCSSLSKMDWFRANSPYRICFQLATCSPIQRRICRFLGAIVWHCWTSPDLKKGVSNQLEQMYTYPWRHRPQWCRARRDSRTRWLFCGTRVTHWTDKINSYLNRSWPAVSQIWSLIVLPSSSMVLILKSTPMVEM